MYGDLRVGRSLLSDFLGYKQQESKPGKSVSDDKKSALSKNLDEPLNEDGDGDGDGDHRVVSHEQLLNAEEKKRIEKGRAFIEETMKNIYDRLQSGKYKNLLVPYEKVKENRQFLSERHSEVYETAIREFHQKCVNINQNPFVLRQFSKLAHLCESGVDERDLIKAIAETCTAEHRLVSDVN